MERRLNKELDAFMSSRKSEILEKAKQLGISDNTEVRQLLQFICDIQPFTVTKEHFTKRKRVKSIVHLADRCCANKAGGSQCTRQKKPDSMYCGTHMKGTPHGIVDDNCAECNQPVNNKIEVWAQDIQGIMYYIDKNCNVYQAEDIIQNKINPKIIAKYVKSGETYNIPEFNL